MFKKWKAVKLRYKLLLVMLIQTVVLVLGYGYFNTVLERDQYQQLTEHNNRLNYENALNTAGMISAMKEIFVSTLRLDNENTVRNTEEILRKMDNLNDINICFRDNNKLWTNILTNYDYVQNISMISLTGSTVFKIGGSEAFFLTITDMKQKWVQDTLTVKGLYSFAMEGEYLRISRAVINPLKYKTQGVMTITIDLGFLEDNFDKNKMYSGQQYGLYINGLCVAGDLDLSAGEVAQIVTARTPNESILIDKKQDSIYLFHVLDSGEEIVSITVLPYQLLFGRILSQNMGIMVAIVLYIVVFFVVTVSVIYSVLNSLKAFEQAFHKIEAGEFGMTVDIPVEGELKGFLDSFNRMSIRLEELINEVYKRRLTEHELEIQMLRNQINPHFFYNTLEALRMNCMRGHEARNIQMIEYLGTVLRYGISSRSDTVPMSEEIRHLEYYVKLHNLRCDTQIDLQVLIPDDIMRYTTIRLLFQPIVENSIQHGISGSEQTLEIQILGYSENDEIIFTVTDNGSGIPEDKVTLINRCMDGENSSNNIGIGLRNVYRRIQLFYGEQYGLSVQSQVGRGTMVKITIPFTQTSV